MEIDNLHFVGVAGTGMSALAQYLGMRRLPVSGSDRRFAESAPPEKAQLESVGVRCFSQDGSGVVPGVRALVVSTAIEAGNPDVDKARELGIPVLHRSELLAALVRERRTIAISGTSGKSTVTGMLYHILERCGMEPSFLGGAGLVDLEQRGLIGNAMAGNGEWLVVEADESDGTLVRYHPEVGVILNIDKDHKEFSELEPLFLTFAAQTRSVLVCNADDPRVKALSRDAAWDFSIATQHDPDADEVGFKSTHFVQDGFECRFAVHHAESSTVAACELPLPGVHNMQNALAAIAAAAAVGVPVPSAAAALIDYAGIHRRHQLLGIHGGVALVDDYAHNPAKIAASIRAVQRSVPGRVLAWWQPHGFGPTRFLRHDLCAEITAALRPGDSMWFSDIYYAGGTVVRDISSADLAADLCNAGQDARCIGDRQECTRAMIAEARSGDAILLMGARDPSLAEFGREVWGNLSRLER